LISRDDIVIELFDFLVDGGLLDDGLVVGGEELF
jgi:hypothetical protein